jgi:hypothetical protein
VVAVLNMGGTFEYPDRFGGDTMTGAVSDQLCGCFSLQRLAATVHLCRLRTAGGM